MKKGFAVLGLGRFGTSVAIHLAETGAEVMVVVWIKTRQMSMK